MIKELKSIGLTEGEAKVYNALLKKGSSTVGPIVKESGVAYSNIYEVLERLMKKGLVTFIIKEKTKYFQTTNPQNLKEFLDKKEKELENQKKILESITPKIINASKITSEEAEVFIGKRGLKSAYKILLQDTKKDEEFLFFHVPDLKKIEEIDDFYLDIGKFFRESKITLKGISMEEYRTSKMLKHASAWTKMKFVDFPVPANVDICRDKVLFISWQKPIGFLIRSKEMADYFRNYFKSVWKIAKK